MGIVSCKLELDSCKSELDSCTVVVTDCNMDPTPSVFDDAEANCRLLRASKEGDVVGVNEALVAGADINTRLPVWIRINTMVETENGDASETRQPFPLSFTPLMNASSEGHVEVVQFLLSFGANPELREADGMQALHLAAQAASAGCFRALLEAGADPLAMDDFSRDPLQCVPLSIICHSAERHEWLALLKEASGISALDAGTSEINWAEPIAHDAAAMTATAIPWHTVPNQHGRYRSRTF